MKLKQLTFEIDGKEITLTEQEARALYAKLAELFENKKPVVYPPYPIPRWDGPPIVTCRDLDGL